MFALTSLAQGAWLVLGLYATCGAAFSTWLASDPLALRLLLTSLHLEGEDNISASFLIGLFLSAGLALLVGAFLCFGGAFA
jgi:hypothetical protein